MPIDSPEANSRYPAMTYSNNLKHLYLNRFYSWKRVSVQLRQFSVDCFGVNEIQLSAMPKRGCMRLYDVLASLPICLSLRCSTLRSEPNDMCLVISSSW